ncbi:hypothetical protein LC593_04080 [Nostoc sp. CHAB 5844]|nr:hypothetical protein [Nostoc sp. CHAB 5844]
MKCLQSIGFSVLECPNLSGYGYTIDVMMRSLSIDTSIKENVIDEAKLTTKDNAPTY